MKLMIFSFFLISLSAIAAAPKTYQVTGPVLEVSDTSFVVQKGKEKWEIIKDPSSKIMGDLKVGAKVTVQYTMTAKEIEAKDSKEDKKSKK